ncbi:MAG: acyl-CoA-binding protein [Moraxellaceae bacterium]|nr:acyl-CoA-binding protein [Pseudomonadales bacterium]MCB1673151.1 acyl-CoA-binding protein [Pseudomonadales bacterium]MCP5173886.1 acyl-CoA-binding protein [Moraxellaceae bacterium]MCP5176798.1 acyl-CoA-binding protein [Moraxellaceae bacterium]HQV23786.1 acyl-CoA-binding protein [Agitococcus sp.]
MSTLEQAQQNVNTLSKKPSNEHLLFLYAHYKQATAGDCVGKRPGMLDVTGRMKFDAWAKLKGLSKTDAEARYIAKVNELLAADGK